MKIIQKLILLFLTIASVYCNIGGYDTVYIMEFENINHDFSINSFKTAFPDLIIENYKFRNDILVTYSNDKSLQSKENYNQKTLIVNGRFKTDEERIDVIVEVYDLRNWDLLNSKSFYCAKQDFICIHDAFLISIEEIISPLLVEVDEEKLPSLNFENQKTSLVVESSNQVAESKENSYIDKIDSGSIIEEFNISFNSINDEFSKEFNFSNEEESSVPLIDKNTERIIHILSQFLSNPYYVDIGEMDIKINEQDIDLIDIEVPVNFSIKTSLIDELLSDIPKQEISNNENQLMLKFSNKDFRFERELIEKLALMKYQLMPTINFVDKKGSLQLLILDSWKRKYGNLTIDGTNIVQRNDFVPLYSIKPGRDNLQVSIDLSSTQILYSFSVRYNTFGDYTKMIVKFMLESELDQYLSVSSRN